MLTRKIGIDLGTANTIVFVPGRGFIINEPTIVALSVPDNTVLAVGREAKEMIGRTPDSIIAYRPLKEGVIADYYITKAMLRYFIHKAKGSFNVFKPEVVLSVPAGISPNEKRAVVNAAREAGAKEAYIVKEPILAALGAGDWSLDHLLGWAEPTSGGIGAAIALFGLVLAGGHLGAYFRKVP